MQCIWDLLFDGSGVAPHPGGPQQGLVLQFVPLHHVSALPMMFPAAIAYSDEVDPHKEEFVQLLNSFRVPDLLQEHIFSIGFDCTADFAFAFPSVENLNPFLLALPETDWHTLDTDDPLSSVHASRVRQAWNACRQNVPQNTTLPAPPTVEATPSPSTWTEMLPPKLTEEAVRKAVRPEMPYAKPHTCRT